MTSGPGKGESAMASTQDKVATGDSVFHLRLLAVLLAGDAVFVAIYLALGLLVVAGHLAEIPDILALGKELSLPEIWDYLKWVSVVLLLASAALRGGPRWTIPMTPVFAIILADDSLAIHEHLGPALAPILPDAIHGMAGSEATAFALYGLAILGLVIAAWRMRRPTDTPGLGTLLWLLALLGLFVVGVDVLHDTIPMGLVAYSLVVIVEDGGEMVVASLILAHVFGAVWLPTRALSAGVDA
jgi:hypothetical protein